MNAPQPKHAHTPGPWEVAHHGTTPGNTSVEVQTETGLPVAVMSYCGSANANASLIARAPDLLAERDALAAQVAALKAAASAALAFWNAPRPTFGCNEARKAELATVQAALRAALNA